MLGVSLLISLGQRVDRYPFRFNDAMLFSLAAQNAKCSCITMLRERARLIQCEALNSVLLCWTSEESGHLFFSSVLKVRGRKSCGQQMAIVSEVEQRRAKSVARGEQGSSGGFSEAPIKTT